MGLFSLIGGIFGGNSAKKASRRAEQAQIAAMDRAIGEQRRQFDLTRSDYSPYLGAGRQALSDISALMGLGMSGGGIVESAEQRAERERLEAQFFPDGNIPRADDGPMSDASRRQLLMLDAIQRSPELAAIIKNGEEAILANASATGGLRGGNTQDFLSRFRGDAFANQIGTQLQRLGGLAGLGMGATDSVSAFGANAANNVSQQMVSQGAARAQGLLTRGGINAQMWNNAGGFLDSAFRKIPGIGSIFG